MHLRSTEDLTVAEVLKNFAPPQANGTACNLVSFGPNEFFLVIQGDQASMLTALLMQALDQLQAKADDSAD